MSWRLLVKGCMAYVGLCIFHQQYYYAYNCETQTDGCHWAFWSNGVFIKLTSDGKNKIRFLLFFLKKKHPLEGHILMYGMGASIRIGWESQFLPYLYTGFLSWIWTNIYTIAFLRLNLDLVSNKLWSLVLTQYYRSILNT